MRLAAISLAVLLCACVQREPRDHAVDACAHTTSHAVTWTSDALNDTVIARSSGPSCKQAVVTLEVRNHAGDPLWAFATTYYDMTSGGVPPEGAPAVSSAQMDAFLVQWANVTTARAGALPEWREGADAPGAGAEGPVYSTPFSRDNYEALRQRNLREICYAAAVTATQCLVVDPASNAPTMIVAYGR